jgi:rare lipoprotein A
MGNRAPERMETPPGLRTALRRRLIVATPSTPDEPPSATLSNGPTRPTINPGMVAARPNPARPVSPLPPAPILAAPRSEPAKAATPKAPPPQPVPPKATPPKLAPKQPVAPTHTAAKSLVIQVAAFSTRERAEKAAAQVGGKVEPAGKFWRVRIVATTEEQARAALAKAKQSGYAGALILHHD